MLIIINSPKILALKSITVCIVYIFVGVCGCVCVNKIHILHIFLYIKSIICKRYKAIDKCETYENIQDLLQRLYSKHSIGIKYIEAIHMYSESAIIII